MGLLDFYYQKKKKTTNNTNFFTKLVSNIKSKTKSSSKRPIANYFESLRSKIATIKKEVVKISNSFSIASLMDYSNVPRKASPPRIDFSQKAKEKLKNKTQGKQGIKNVKIELDVPLTDNGDSATDIANETAKAIAQEIKNNYNIRDAFGTDDIDIEVEVDIEEEPDGYASPSWYGGLPQEVIDEIGGYSEPEPTYKEMQSLRDFPKPDVPRNYYTGPNWYGGLPQEVVDEIGGYNGPETIQDEMQSLRDFPKPDVQTGSDAQNLSSEYTDDFWSGIIEGFDEFNEKPSKIPIPIGITSANYSGVRTTTSIPQNQWSSLASITTTSSTLDVKESGKKGVLLNIKGYSTECIDAKYMGVFNIKPKASVGIGISTFNSAYSIFSDGVGVGVKAGGIFKNNTYGLTASIDLNENISLGVYSSKRDGDIITTKASTTNINTIVIGVAALAIYAAPILGVAAAAVAVSVGMASILKGNDNEKQ